MCDPPIFADGATCEASCSEVECKTMATTIEDIRRIKFLLRECTQEVGAV